MRYIPALIVHAMIAVTTLAQSPETLPATLPSTGAQANYQSDPVPPPGPADQAVATYARGDYGAVVNLLEGPYKAGKASIQHRLILARAYLHLQRPDDALAVLKSIHADDRENGEANSLAGQILLKAGKGKEALEYLKQAYRLKKDAPTASLLGRCYYALGQSSKAKPLLEEAAQQDIRDPDNSFLVGRICLDRGLGALAEKYLLAAQEAGMETAELHLLLARAYVLQRKFVGPVIVRQMASAGEPGSIVSEGIVLGPAEGTADQYRIAHRFCGLYEGYQLLKADAKHAEGLYAVARGWFAVADLDRAAKYLEMLEAREAGSKPALELGSELLIAKKDFGALEKLLAGEAARKAFSTEELGEFYYEAGTALRGQGKRQEALAMLAEAEKHLPTSGGVLRALGGLHLAMGNRDEAARYYARMVELFPDAADIDELRNTLKVLRGKGLEETPGGGDQATSQPDDPFEASADEPPAAVQADSYPQAETKAADTGGDDPPPEPADELRIQPVDSMRQGPRSSADREKGE